MSAAAALLLSDARFPAGGHAHSGGLEPAATARTVTDISSLELFLRGRLRTAGLVAAGLAAAACHHAATGPGEGAGEEIPRGVRDKKWLDLDLEADARTPSPAQRDASRKQGRALLRTARRAWPDAEWPPHGAGPNGAPHHAIVIGAAAAAAGERPVEAARSAAYQSVAGPSSAAVRLLALDPLAAAAMLARLAPAVDEVAAEAARHANGPLADLPCPSAPALDLLAEAHIAAEVRLFES
jgi:urease accessory protein